MMMRNALFFLILLVLGASGAAAQTDSVPVLKDNSNPNTSEETYRVGDVRGNIRRKAVFLPKPPYPPGVLEAGADGTVRVEIVIDAEGSVVSAKAISGHPLLYETAETTALKTKFRRAAAADPNFKETGVIVYSFAIERAGWLRIGYDLAVIQKAPTLRPFIVSRVAKAFEADWKGELELLGKLAEMRRIEMQTDNAVPEDKPVFVRKTDPSQKGARQSSISAEIKIPVPNPPTGERIAVAQNLTANLQSRLAGNESDLWKFNLGVNLVKTLEMFRNPTENRAAAEILRQFADSAPSDISPETLTALREVIEFYESGRRSVESRAGITKSLGVLLNSK
jgi:TonB family protein